MFRNEHIPNRAVCALCFFLALGGSPAAAHPMGNFSISHYAKLKLTPNGVAILYLLDLAEIPAFQEIRRANLVPNDGDPGLAAYLEAQVRTLAQNLTVECDGKRVALRSVSRHVAFSEGAGGLPTMKLRLVFEGPLPKNHGTHNLSYADNNFAGRTGWKEIVVLSDGLEIVSSTAHDKDRSNELSNYSADLLDAPPQKLSATVTFREK